MSVIIRYFPPPDGGPIYIGQQPIEGDTHYICVDDIGSHAYVLSATGSSTSTLISYDCENYVIDGELELQGFPLDLTYGDGKLIVLTAE